MIITKQKSFSQVLEYIKDDKKVFLIGCTLCATTCKTGGEDQVKDMGKALEKEGKTVTGWAILDPACSLLAIKQFYRKEAIKVAAADAILSLACGGGTQAVIDVIRDKKVYPVNDTIFQGEITKLTLQGGRFDQKCSLCGECVLESTGGICAVTRCPKGLLNGPCGGIKNGKCEIDVEMDCAWLLIYDRLKELNQIDKMKKILPPKDHSKNKKPESHSI